MSSVSTKIITNRQLNFTISPVDTHNAKKMPHTLQHYEIDGTWNHHQSIILDVIIDFMFKRFYQQHKKLPQSWRSLKVLEKIDGLIKKGINRTFIDSLSLSPREAYSKYMGYDFVAKLREDYEDNDNLKKNMTFEEYVDREFENNASYKDYIKSITENKNPLHTDWIFEFKFSDILKDYSFLQVYKYTFFEHLNKISATKFRMKYKIKFISDLPKFDEKGKLVERGRLSDYHYQMREYQSLFEVEGDKNKFKLNFKSPLSKLVIYNMLIMDTDWCPVEAMALSKNAYFLFKRFVLNRVSGKHKAESITLNFDEIKAFLDFSWSNGRGVHKAIAKALTDMVDKGVVSGYQENRNHGRERTYELTFDHGAAGDNGAED